MLKIALNIPVTAFFVQGYTTGPGLALDFGINKTVSEYPNKLGLSRA